MVAISQFRDHLDPPWQFDANQPGACTQLAEQHAEIARVSPKTTSKNFIEQDLVRHHLTHGLSKKLSEFDLTRSEVGHQISADQLSVDGIDASTRETERS